MEKKIKDIIENVVDLESAWLELKAAQTLAAYHVMTEKDLNREIKRTEKDMHDAAKNLEFEKAAELRDRLKELKQVLFGIGQDNESRR